MSDEQVTNVPECCAECSYLGMARRATQRVEEAHKELKATKAEIESLKTEYQTVKQCYKEDVAMLEGKIKTAKAEAVKGFAEELKQVFSSDTSCNKHIRQIIDYTLRKSKAGES